MTIEEYSSLMGYKETCEWSEYEAADFIYMMAGDMDKQTFCKEYKKVGTSPLITILADAANSRGKAFRDKEEREKQTAHSLLRVADEIREIRSDEAEESADQIDRIAAKLIGRTECIKWKLRKGYRLSDTDNEYIADNLQ